MCMYECVCIYIYMNVYTHIYCALFKKIDKIRESFPSLQGNQNLTRALCQSQSTNTVTFL